MNKIKIAEDFDVCIMYRCMILSLYTYNHTGERSLKRYGAFNTAYLNGAYAGSGLDGLTRYSAYVSPYYVEHGTGVNASTTTKHYYIGTERLVSKLVTESGGKEDVKDEDTYYYFTDHLGSTTHITDKGGNVVQYAAYTPYGMLFREYKSVMPYKFNGKELDQETGYYYYGARYYDPSAVLWIGVDPLQMKYPEVSPYVYCAGNPVVRIDPDGRWVLAIKMNVTAGAGMSYALSAKAECGIAFDKYGATMFGNFTGNCFANQNLQDGSTNPRIFAGAYAGVGVSADYSWSSDSYADYAATFSTSVPVGPATASFGEDGVGIGIGLGFGIAFETSPTSSTASLSMSNSEMGTAMGFLSRDLGLMKLTCNPQDEKYQIIENDIVVGYKGVVTFSEGNNSVQYNVTCKAVNGQPSNQWETHAYTANKQGEQ